MTLGLPILADGDPADPELLNRLDHWHETTEAEPEDG